MAGAMTFSVGDEFINGRGDELARIIGESEHVWHMERWKANTTSPRRIYFECPKHLMERDGCAWTKVEKV